MGQRRARSLSLSQLHKHRPHAQVLAHRHNTPDLDPQAQHVRHDIPRRDLRPPAVADRQVSACAAPRLPRLLEGGRGARESRPLAHRPVPDRDYGRRAGWRRHLAHGRQDGPARTRRRIPLGAVRPQAEPGRPRRARAARRQARVGQGWSGRQRRVRGRRG
ncbi:hypothetical protein CC85DRAFT_327099 [Cutaneotrichosporon oleaginosum]|uniref:Uncharacterized protein n=1 Tax=Cutaneotrichosporon oleaginosum TaxID=879819 RepID=A0A0J1B7L9_9TREE|nr:uncharacterized protein CC85DRAFT_327099 [Cutaneotrichosporon oleaginosum]KLT43749.1 hypothetical protein CC85DRAFT_327099 [Cutaneotrichosporon oleaginosum]TXT05166.1 hypothetical protein COLE_06486 [Cutaneotrichosporon oleaginosum]